MKTVLVTGAGGFTATYLLPLLRSEEGIGICGISPEQSHSDRYLERAYRGDVLDAEFLRAVVRDVAPDRVYHLAAVVPIAEVNRDFRHALRVNVEGTYNLLEAVAGEAPGTRVLIVGSSDEYGGRSREEMPLSEADGFAPVNGYGVTKVAQELLARLFHQERGMPVLFTRTFNFTGPGQPPEFVCSSFARQVASCRLRAGGTIRVGNLDVSRDFLDIRDAVSAYRVIMEKGSPGRVYNVCSGEAVSLRWILETLRDLAGVPITIERDEGRMRKVDIPYLLGNNDRLRELGWRRKIPIVETLRDLLRDWESRAE